MPSQYSPPDVIVTQVQRTRSGPRITPALSAVVIGLCRQVAVRAVGGVFDVGDDLVFEIPDLKPGAVIDPASIELLINAVTSAGRSLGLFRLDTGVPADAQVINDANGNPSQIRVYGTLGLEYSLLSSRNNDLDTLNDDRAVGVPSGLNLIDASIDFASIGVSGDGTCYVTISSPSTLAGRYIVRATVATGSLVNTLTLEKVNAANAVELQKGFTVISGFASNKTIYGFPATHARLAFGNSNSVNDAAIITGNTAGIGIEAVQISVVTADIADIHNPVVSTTVVPGPTSSAATWFKPGTPVTAGTDFGTDNAAWKSIMATAKVGSWLRFVGRWNAGVDLIDAVQIRDYQVVAVDTAQSRLQLQNPDGDPNNTTPDTTVVGDFTDLYLLKVVRGSGDATNAAGDYVVSAGLTYEVKRAAPYLIELATAFPTTVSTVPAVYQRGLAFRNTTANYDVLKNLTTGFGGQVLMSYRADRTDLTGQVISLATELEVEETLGLILPTNPLALGVSLALRASGNAGVIVFAVPTNANTVSDYSSALELLKTREDVYWVTPLSEDKAVISLVTAHVNTMSQPLNKGERRALVSTILDTIDPVLPNTTTAVALAGAIPSGIANRLNATIDWSLVSVGELIWLVDVDGNKLESQRISSIVVGSNYALTFVGFSAIYVGTSVSFRIETYPRSKQQQAEAWRDYGLSLNNKRISILRPDRVEISYTDKTGPRPVDRTELLPGYFACCAFAGFRSVLEPQKPVTNMPVPGIGKLVHSNFYFSPDQLNTIAEGGNMLLVQRDANAAPTVRHQLTSNMDSIEERELSIGTLVDYCAKVVRNGMRPFIGKHNITDEYLTQLRGVAEALIRALVQSGVLRPGSSLTRLEQNKDRPDEIDLDISFVVPYPCNRINVKIHF